LIFPRLRKTARFATILCLSFMVGCSSIPIMVPDMSTRAPRQVKLEGASGPLSSKQSKAILARLEKSRPGAKTNIFERHLAIEEAVAGSPLVVGNKIVLLIDGPTTYDSMFAAIEQAKDHINLETYILEDDEIGRRFADALIKKQQSGVQVNLIYDSVGCRNTPADFFKRMADSGIKVLEFNPINPLNARKGWYLNKRDHRKLLVVDGKVAFIGGINISSVYSSSSLGSATKGSSSRWRGPSKSAISGSGSSSPGFKPADPPPLKPGQPWRDTHMRMEGPVVAEFQKIFMETWNKQKDEPLPQRNYFPELVAKGHDVVRAIASSPDEPYSVIYATLLSAIKNAETYIYITNAYFVPDEQLSEALKDAAKRGVDVRLLLPGKSDFALVLHASHSYYTDLLESDVKIYEQQEALLHAKTALIDGVWSTVGSTNLDWRSFIHNQELDAVILGYDFGGQMRSMFEKDLQESKPILLQEWKKRSLLKRLKERVARLWARWL